MKLKLYLQALILLPANFWHEISHAFIGFILLAEPQKISLVPKITRIEENKYSIVYGYVSFSNLTWYNAAPTAMAPLLLMFLPWFYYGWFIEGLEYKGAQNMHEFIVSWILMVYLSLVSIWGAIPSSVDFKVMFSKPLGVLFYGGLLYLGFAY